MAGDVFFSGFKWAHHDACSGYYQIVDSSVDFVDGDLPCEGRCLVELFSQQDARAQLPQVLPHDTFETLHCGGVIAGLWNAVILCIIRRVKALQEREVSR